MKRYNAYDQQIGEKMFKKPSRAVQKIHSPQAYLASYYKFRVERGCAVEIGFYGTGVEFKCVQGEDLGIVSIELDGESKGKFDLYSETMCSMSLAFK